MSTNSLTPSPSPETTEIWVLLNLVHQSLSARFEAELRRCGLPTAAWYDVLWGLERASEGLRQYELQDFCLYDQPNLSRTLKRMIDDGLVEAERAKDDARGRVLRLTQAGKELRARMWQVYGGLMVDTIEHMLTSEQAHGLVEGLGALVPETMRQRLGA